MSISPLPRRTFLRGLGASLSLPYLDAMIPAGARAAEKAVASAAPTRMAYIYLPNGAIMPQWTPSGEGEKWELSPTLSSLKNVKDQLQVITGLMHDKAEANGDGGGDHARATATFLTGVQARKTSGADIRLGVSVDQEAARVIGKQTRLDSLQLGCDPGRKAGNCDSGYSCAYQFNFSWKSPTLPLAPEVDPRLVFEKLFGSTDSGEDAKSRGQRMRHESSLLDYVFEDAKSLQKTLGHTDRLKVDEYLSAVRELERKIENAEKFRASLPAGENRPDGIPREYREHVRVMYELMALAFQTDTTRIATFLVAHDGSNRSFSEIGVPEGHHHLSHHRKDAEKMAKLEKIDRFYVEQFAKFLEVLKTTKEADGRNLLDSSMIVYGGGISDADRHDHDNLPVILAGGGNGQLRRNRHLKTKEPVPMTNLYLSLLDRAGVKLDRLGDSTGRFDLI
jgi:hypothetical protein